MIAPLMIAERLEARALAANAVRSAFYERFGEHPSAEDRLWQIDPIARLDFVGDVELKLGVAFRDEDVEFLETPSDLIERGTEILIRGGVR
jgi:hypothetical protein